MSTKQSLIEELLSMERLLSLAVSASPGCLNEVVLHTVLQIGTVRAVPIWLQSPCSACGMGELEPEASTTASYGVNLQLSSKPQRT